MPSVLKSLFGSVGAALVFVACAAPATAPVTSASFEPENVLTIGRGASEPAAVPAPAAAPAPGAAPTALPPGYALAAPTVSEEPAGGQNSYRLRPRDFIRVLVINEPDTQIERRINSDGTVDIPFLKKARAS